MVEGLVSYEGGGVLSACPTASAFASASASLARAAFLLGGLGIGLDIDHCGGHLVSLFFFFSFFLFFFFLLQPLPSLPSLPSFARTLGRSLVGGVGALHAGQGLGYAAEEGLDVVAELGAGLDEHEVVLLGLVLALLGGDLALVVQVRLVAYQDDDDVVPPLGPHVVYPLLGVLERLGICCAV